MRFIFACGGTAGHINPALAVAGRLRELMPDCEILFIGAEGHMELELVPRSGYKIEALHVTNISRKKNLEGIWHNVKSAVNVIRATAKAKKIIRRFKPDVVIGTGGYVCYPVLRAAAKLGIPTAVHESNAVPGLTTRMLSRLVDKIMLGFEESRRFYRYPEKTAVTGTPVRGEFSRYTKNGAKAELGIPPDKPLVVSVWGSLGAENMNKLMCGFIELSGSEPPFRLIHSAGSEGYEEMTERLRSTVPEHERYGMEVREYIYDMPRVMAAADVVMCRAGASTVSELTYMHKPTVFVPSPYVTDDHQMKNARVIENAGGALIFEEGQVTARELYDKLNELLSSPEKLGKMSDVMARLARPEAANSIVEEILELAK